MELFQCHKNGIISELILQANLLHLLYCLRPLFFPFLEFQVTGKFLVPPSHCCSENNACALHLSCSAYWLAQLKYCYYIIGCITDNRAVWAKFPMITNTVYLLCVQSRKLQETPCQNVFILWLFQMEVKLGHSGWILFLVVPSARLAFMELWNTRKQPYKVMPVLVLVAAALEDL